MLEYFGGFAFSGRQSVLLTLKAPITAAADKKFWDIFPNFRQKKGMILHENLCQQLILMKYQA